MEECQTPTLAQMVEFKYELTPTMVFDRSRQVDNQNRLTNCINMRCFTPTIKNFQSPGLSPINECPQMVLSGGFGAGVATNVDNFQKSSKEEHFKAPLGKKPKQKVVTQQQQQQQQQLQQQLAQKQQQTQTQQQQKQHQHQQHQQQQKFNYGTFMSDSPPVFTLNSTTNSDIDSSSENSDPECSEIIHGNLNGNSKNNDNNNNNSSSNKNKNHNNNNNNNNSDSSGGSNNSGILNSSSNNNKNLSRNNNTTNLLNVTMNISTLLRSVGLEQYIESFEANIFDLSQFSNLHMEDFPRLGVCKAEHQTIILDLLSKLNGD